MNKIFQTSSSILAILLLASGSLAGCGSSDSPSNDFSADCSSCFNGVPIGPSADMESCSAFSAAFNCSNAPVLENEGMCTDSFETSATCQVSGCASDPSSCSLDE